MHNTFLHHWKLTFSTSPINLIKVWSVWLKNNLQTMPCFFPKISSLNFRTVQPKEQSNPEEGSYIKIPKIENSRLTSQAISAIKWNITQNFTYSCTVTNTFLTMTLSESERCTSSIINTIWDCFRTHYHKHYLKLTRHKLLLISNRSNNRTTTTQLSNKCTFKKNNLSLVQKTKQT